MTAIEGRLTGAAGVNPSTPDTSVARIGAGRLDRLMASGSALARFQPEGASYTVKAGDTLSDVAARHGSDWQTLARINGLADSDRLAVGQVLQLPDRRAAQIHVVRPGETLSGIARQSGIPVKTLADTNRLADADLIRPGQRLMIGGGGQPKAPSVSSTPRDQSVGNAPAHDGQPVPDAASIRAADIAAERAAGHPSIGKCYAWVKTALQQSGAVPDYMPGVAAKGAGPALEARGFVNLLDRPGNGIRSPYDAPKGAVLVYGAAPGATDRNARYGHIEIRTGAGFASDYASANARTGSAANGLEGRGRVLIGVYVKPAATPMTTPAAGRAAATGDGRLGNLSMKYETGYAPGQEGAAAAKVSSGIGDPGGKSYGAYQLTSSASSGAQVKKFLASEGAAWATRFDGLDPTKAGAFEQTWKAVAAEQPAAFFKAQHDYIERTHYGPVAERAQAAGLDLSTQPQAVRDAVWSMSVQHAGASRIIATALDSLPKGGASGAREIIDAFYDARSAYVQDVAMPAETRQSLLDRYVAERRDALAMLPE